jgi:hypothetical protein
MVTIELLVSAMKGRLHPLLGTPRLAGCYFGQSASVQNTPFRLERQIKLELFPENSKDGLERRRRSAQRDTVYSMRETNAGNGGGHIRGSAWHLGQGL